MCHVPSRIGGDPRGVGFQPAGSNRSKQGRESSFASTGWKPVPRCAGRGLAGHLAPARPLGGTIAIVLTCLSRSCGFLIETNRPDRGTMDEQGGSITHWLGDLKGGDLAAAQPLWERYFGKLVVLARAKLQKRRHTGVEADEEDAALSAFNSFCVGVAGGKFPQLADREDLWKILVTITARKAFAQAQRQNRLKRGGGRVVEEAVLRGARGGSPHDPSSTPGLEMIAGNEPTPEFAAMVAEEYQRLLDALEDDGLQAGRRQPDGRLHLRRDRGPARLRPPDRGPPARPDPQDLAGGRRGGLMPGGPVTRGTVTTRSRRRGGSTGPASDSRPSGGPAGGPGSRTSWIRPSPTTGSRSPASSSRSRSSSATIGARCPARASTPSRFRDLEVPIDAIFREAGRSTGRGGPGNGSFLSPTEAYESHPPSRPRDRPPGRLEALGLPRGRRAHRRLPVARGDRAGRDGGRLQGPAASRSTGVVALKMILTGAMATPGRARAVPPRGRARGRTSTIPTSCRSTRSATRTACSSSA